MTRGMCISGASDKVRASERHFYIAATEKFFLVEKLEMAPSGVRPTTLHGAVQPSGRPTGRPFGQTHMGRSDKVRAAQKGSAFRIFHFFVTGQP